MSDTTETHASATRKILKIGLAVTEGNRILLVKKRDGHSYILPGGKPEMGEEDVDALQREIREELGCTIDIDTVKYLGSFTDVAADLTGVTVTVRLYRGQLIGNPSPHSEIEYLKWANNFDDSSSLAPSLRNHIFPFLRSLSGAFTN